MPTTPSFPATSESAQSVTPPPISDHELLRLIGSGSYGDVWLARNVLGEFRAVKIIYRSRFSDPRPFEREFEGIQRFKPISRSHPSQLHILHVGKNDDAGCFYYLMELADTFNIGARAVPARGGSGEAEHRGISKNPSPTRNVGERSRAEIDSYVPHTLRRDLEHRGRLPIPDCVQIGISLATALAHLHDQGLVHRDIKPSNIIFVNGVAKLGDIGLVTETGDTQSIVGTEGYLPPEGPGTRAADIYALGKVLYEACTGMDRRQLPELPKDLREWSDAGQVLELNEIVIKACAREVDLRYGVASQMRAELELLRDGKSVQRVRRLATWRRHAVMAALAFAVLAVGATFLGNRLRREESLKSPDGPPSTNELANALCNQALLNLRGDNRLGVPTAYSNLHRAIQLDPYFVRPYVGLLEMIREPTKGINVLPEDCVPAVARRLKELAPDSAPAHCAQSILAFKGLDFPEAKRQLDLALQANPNYELAEACYGASLINWGLPVEARRHLMRAKEINSSKSTIFGLIGDSYFQERDFPRAIESYRVLVAFDPKNSATLWELGRAYRAMGDYRKAIEMYAQAKVVASGGPLPAGNPFDRLREAYEERGRQGYWEEKWRQLPPNASCYSRAAIRARLEDVDGAFELLRESLRVHECDDTILGSVHLGELVVDDDWDPLRQDPRFKALLKAVGFTKVNPKLAE